MMKSWGVTLKLSALLLAWLVATPAAGEAGWTSYAYVSELTATSRFRYLVTLKEAANPSGCKNKGVFYMDQNGSGSEQGFHLLVEALTHGKHVRLYVTGNCDLNGHSEISAVSITP